MTHRAEHRDPSPRRSLVSGGAGFLGSHLVDLLLARGDQVTVVDDLSTGRIENLPCPGRERHGLRFIEATIGSAITGELADESGFDEIYHLAAAVGVMRILDRPAESIETNVLETGALLRYAIDHDPAHRPRVLIASSSEVYGLGGNGVSLKEDDPCTYGPTTAHRWSYGYAKAVDEFLALAHHREHGLPVVIARFFNIIGPRQLGRHGMVVPRFVEAALKADALDVFGDGTQVRTLCDVRDAVPALPALLGNDAALGLVVNIGSDRPISVRELAQVVTETLNSASDIRTIPYHEAYVDGFQDLPHRCPDLTRVRGLCGFRASTTLEHTIRDIAASMSGENRSAEDSRTSIGS